MESLGEEALAAVRQLKEEKYDTWEWTCGRTPVYGMTNRRRFAGGSLAVSLAVEEGRIASITFRGDFLSRKDPQEVEAALRGLPCRRAEVAAALEKVALADYFGAVTAEELLETIFCT